MTYTVYNDNYQIIGHADSFGDCKKIHKEWLEGTNHPRKEYYAGLDCSGGSLESGMAYPEFYMED